MRCKPGYHGPGRLQDTLATTRYNQPGNAILLAAILTLAALVLPGPARALDKVTLQLQCVHQAQFAGFYLAQDAGIYRRAGLEVKIRPGGPGIRPLVELAAGRCDFATAWLCGALQARARGVPVLNLAQLIQRSALLLISLGDRDIQSVKDLEGRRVGLWGGDFSVAPRALFTRAGIRVQEVPLNVSVTPLLKRAVDASAAMRYNEYHQLYQAGVNWEDMVVIDFAEQGLNFPEDGIYTLESTWRKRGDVCRRLVRASLEGWRLALDKPEQALRSVMKRVDAARLASNLSHQRWMLKTVSNLITNQPGDRDLGHLSPHDFALVQKVLLEQGLIKQPVALSSFAVDGWK